MVSHSTRPTIGGADQPSKSIKDSTMCSRVRSALKIRSSVAWDQGTLVIPSPAESECSTLMEFAIDTPVDPPPSYGSLTEANDAEDTDCRIAADDRAWARENNDRVGEIARQGMRRCHRSSFFQEQTSYAGPAFEAEMLDEEDRAWDSPARSPKSGGRSWSKRLFVRKDKKACDIAQESHTLEPDNCAWM